MGLRGYDCVKCSARNKIQRGCRLQGRTLIAASPFSVDYHKPARPHLDQILFCPASVPGIYALQQEVFDCLAIKEGGGLREWYDVPASQLPAALVALYRDVEDATERFAAEIRAAVRKPKPAPMGG